jgi:hypothetical protein
MSKAILPFFAAASPYQIAGIVKSLFEDDSFTELLFCQYSRPTKPE